MAILGLFKFILKWVLIMSFFKTACSNYFLLKIRYFRRTPLILITTTSGGLMNNPKNCCL